MNAPKRFWDGFQWGTKWQLTGHGNETQSYTMPSPTCRYDNRILVLAIVMYIEIEGFHLERRITYWFKSITTNIQQQDLHCLQRSYALAGAKWLEWCSPTGLIYQKNYILLHEHRSMHKNLRSINKLHYIYKNKWRCPQCKCVSIQDGSFLVGMGISCYRLWKALEVDENTSCAGQTVQKARWDKLIRACSVTS